MKTYLAFDFGKKRVGFSIGNDFTRSAQPLVTLTYTNKDQLFEQIETILAEWQPDELVVGLPTHPDGQPHDMTARATRFAHQLQGRFNLKVHLVDERYSSVAVEGGNDALAAAVILEQFLSPG